MQAMTIPERPKLASGKKLKYWILGDYHSDLHNKKVIIILCIPSVIVNTLLVIKLEWFM